MAIPYIMLKNKHIQYVVFILSANFQKNCLGPGLKRNFIAGSECWRPASGLAIPASCSAAATRNPRRSSSKGERRFAGGQSSRCGRRP